MSSLPDIFRSIQSDYIRPTKQGGIFSIKYQTIQVTNQDKIQPEDYFSANWVKSTPSRAGTSHTLRSQKISSMGNTRNIATS